ncbi:MAG: ribosomal RNA small subunit methyltransferase A [Gemmatimonadales bacterium]|nr:ribosomal RNA small subunit methyltransferase A [Gemmatimonadales bacterium]
MLFPATRGTTGPCSCFGFSVVRAKKGLGQHFLHDRRILGRIADAAGVAPGAAVLEIGPGQGALTAALAERGGRVTAIEKDRDLLPLLRERFPAVRFVEGDALELDWREVAGVGPREELVIAGNIPYNITSPLIDHALKPPRPVRIVFLVQKEVADRVAAKPGNKTYGALSVGVQSVAKVEKLFTVPAGAFSPAPRVDSAVIRLTPLSSPLLPPDLELPAFRRLVVGLFGFRRKQLTRGLRELTGWPAARTDGVLSLAGLVETARPETIAPEGFVRLLRRLIDEGWTPR